jgi:two-component system response regulator ChvI
MFGTSKAVPSAETRGFSASNIAKGNKAHLIFVEDDDDFREAASAELEDLGFEVTSFATGEALLASAAAGLEADAIVLDWNLPTIMGVDLVSSLRREGVHLPIVFLTGRSTPNLESLALDGGALDFVDKSRGMPILAKRVRLIMDALRKPAIAVSEAIRSGGLLLKVDVKRAYWNDVDVGLTLTEFNVVHLLASQAGSHVSYRAVYDRMHHAGFIAGTGEDGYRTNVRSTIKRIRNKFRTLDAAFDGIENYPSFGYRWMTPGT